MMANLDGWDISCLVAGAYIAVMALVRLMRAHRRKITGELQEQFRAEQERNQAKGKKKPGGKAA